jgi:hypothetical protein
MYAGTWVKRLQGFRFATIELLGIANLDAANV